MCFICKMRFTVYTAETKIKDTFLLTYYCAVRNSVDIVFLFFLNVFNDIIRTEILRMHIIYHRLIYTCMFEYLRLEN